MAVLVKCDRIVVLRIATLGQDLRVPLHCLRLLGLRVQVLTFQRDSARFQVVAKDNAPLAQEMEQVRARLP